MYVYHKFGLEGATIIITFSITDDMDIKFISDGIEWDWMIEDIYNGVYTKSLQECYNNAVANFIEWSEDSYGPRILEKLQLIRANLENHESW